MSYPILYNSTETKFDHNGLGILSNCVSCTVTEEANGAFELFLKYPIDGIHFSQIGNRSIIKAKPDPFREPQLFRVYSISKPMSGIVSISAQHISYDLSGIPVVPAFSAPSAASALSAIRGHVAVACPFEFWTDKSTEAKFSVTKPSSIRSLLGGSQGSILDIYGGEFEWDNFTVKLHNSRGLNRGVSIRYGKNLTNFQQEQNCSSVATGVFPYWADSEGNNLVMLPERILHAPGNYDFSRIKVLDLSGEFEEAPTENQIRSKTESYIRNNDIGVPTVSFDISYAQLEQSEEYKHLKLLERVSLFDEVNVEFPDMGVSATAKAVKIVYDVIADRVKSVSLGSVRANIADTIVEQQKEMQSVPTKSDLQKAQEAATKWLTNGKGYAYFRKDDLGNIVDILFMDTQDVATAVNVMRVGQSGIGFSHSGVNGPYKSAWTIDGSFNADFITGGILDATVIQTGTLDATLITSGNLNADVIRSGSIASPDGALSMSLDTPSIQMSRRLYSERHQITRYDEDGISVYLDPSDGPVSSTKLRMTYSEPDDVYTISSGVRLQLDGFPLSLGSAQTEVKILGRSVHWEMHDGKWMLYG